MIIIIIIGDFIPWKSHIIWNENTTWDNVEGLDTARNVPKKLLSQRNPTTHPSPPQDISP